MSWYKPEGHLSRILSIDLYQTAPCYVQPNHIAASCLPLCSTYVVVGGAALSVMCCLPDCSASPRAVADLLETVSC